MKNSQITDSSNQADMISNLPEVALLLILSFLSFKDNIKTSMVSKSWRSLCYETKNIGFKESEYVDDNVFDKHSKRASFVRYMYQYVHKLTSPVLESFEICFSDPVGFKGNVEDLIHLVASRSVKNLLLDFSDPLWGNRWDLLTHDDLVVELPAIVYSLQTLEELKIYACKFVPSKFENLGLLRKLSIGYFEFEKIDSLLSKYPALESLSLNSCRVLAELILIGKFRELVIEHCKIFTMYCYIDSPNLDIFKYTGNVVYFHFNDKMSIEEVYLDFTVEHLNEEPVYSTTMAGLILSNLLNKLRSARNLTVCSYLLEVIPECDHPVDMLGDLETKHLVLNTNLDSLEFMGIRLLLDNCPNLETLTLNIQNPSPFQVVTDDNNEDICWLSNISFRCLRTLKIVVVKYFYGSWNEFYMLWYLTRPEHGDVLERIELHMPKYLDGFQKKWVHVIVKTLKRNSGRAQVILHND